MKAKSMCIEPKFIVAMSLAALLGPAASAERVGKPAITPTQPRAEPSPAAGKYRVDCSISPDLCMTAPVARGCGEGRHWSSAGSGFAHCVEDDRNCADGKPAQRDEYDNLVCADEKAAGEQIAGEAGAGNAAPLKD